MNRSHPGDPQKPRWFRHPSCRKRVRKRRARQPRYREKHPAGWHRLHPGYRIGQTKDKRDDEDTEEAMGLTNPLLDRKFQAIIDEESSKEETPTRLLLLNIVNNTRAILNEGINLPLLIEMAQMIRKPAGTIDYEKLQSWIGRLRLQPMADLLGTLNVMLLGLGEAEVPFMKKNLEKTATQLTEELFNLKDGSTDEWYFTQKDDEIFVRTHNSRAMFWHVGHSARFSRLYPSEALTNFFRSFANSLTHIEE